MMGSGMKKKPQVWTCERLQKTQEASAVVKHICLAHVYIEKPWRSGAVEGKNEFCELPLI